jgi:P-type Ca2+ transporter type 2C
LPHHSEQIHGLLARLGVDPSAGLAHADVTERLARDGPNRMPEPPKKSAMVRLVAQFANPLVLTLLVAAFIAVAVGLSEGRSGFLSRFGDAIAIFLIVVVNAILGFVQEARAEAALEALERITSPTARVRRGGVVSVVAAADVVPGDILELEAGDLVGADARLLETVNLAAEEASLTGESTPSSKDARQPLADDAPLAEQATMVFLGTTIVRGKARAVVVATGIKTELGKIGELISRVKKEKTPLEGRLESFGRRILWACLGISVVLFTWGMIKGGRRWPELLLEAVSFAVAAIPEGLPAITTITLALGMQRMAKRGAIVRRLLAVETLGAASVICTDKTGTLTQNEMTVRHVFAGSTRYRVTGQGYDPRGQIVRDADDAPVVTPDGPLDALLSTAALCNNARIDIEEDTHRWKAIGDPTEAALLTLAAKGGRARESIVSSHQFVRELPFDSDRKRMTVVTLDERGRVVAHVKGSLDVLLPLCTTIEDEKGVRPITDEDRARVQQHADHMSQDALRVLAIAERVRPDEDDPEQQLTLLGVVGMIDPPREGVKEAVRACRDAGIRVVMITGDHPLTATAIARELELWSEGDEVVTGVELTAMSDEELERRIMHLRVFARTTAEQKLRIVRALRALGHVVAMTGDGVNDAPALKESDIGVAMGLSGTDVARQASDLVLADDNFATVVEAVREGRSIYRNIQKFIYFLLSSNAGLAVAVFVVSFFREALPLTPLMILWINLVTNGLPALALGVDPADPGQMREPPRPSKSGLLSRGHYVGILYVGVVMGLLAVSLYLTKLPGAAGLVGFDRAMAFTLLALSPLFHAFSCRSASRSVISQRPLVSWPLVGACILSAGVHLVAVAVPALRPVFRTFPMTALDWALVVGLSFAIIPAVELMKGVNRMRSLLHKTGPAIVLLSLMGVSTVARADGIAIRLDLVQPREIKIDGVPREWPSAMVDLGKVIQGSPRSDLGMRGALAYDDENLYVAAEIKDNHFVHTSPCADGEDHAALVIAFPKPAGGFALHEIELYPGDPGKIAGCVKRKGGGPVAGARIVEAPKGVPGVMTFEALIPWRTFAEAALVRAGLRGALRYYDGDGRIQNVLSTSTEVTPVDLPRLPIEPEQSLADGLLKERGITHGPTHDRYADVAGDAMLERVLVFDRYLVVLGPHFRQGKEYYFADLVVDSSAGQLPLFELRDVNGDGKADVVVRRRIPVGDGYREVAQVFAVVANDTLEPIFTHEVGIKTPVGSITNDLKFTTEGGKPGIIIGAGTSSGLNAANYHEAAEPSMEPLLLPWGTIKAQVYQFAARGFAKVREEKQAPKAMAGRVAAAEPEMSLAAAARPPTTDELQEQLYALYKKERKVGKNDRPRFDVAADFAEDSQNERLLLHGRDLVVFGRGYKKGVGYAYISLDQFTDAKDILDVTARDLTGDGKSEIIVRGVLRSTPPKEMGFDKSTVVDREVVLVYEVTSQGIQRVFGAETGRAIGAQRVQGGVALLPGPRGLDLELRPGLAFGWTDRTYPFNQDTGKVGGMEPLILPWGGAAPVRYRWDGTAFTRP